VEEQFLAMLANRTPAKLALPDQYDWITGEKINNPGLNVMARLWNTYAPNKVGKKISPVKQFLIDIEYDARPSMATDGRGEKLDLDMQAQLYKRIGQNGMFRREVERIMKSTTGQEFRAAMKKGGYPDKKKFTYIFDKLNAALRLAREQAVEQMDIDSSFKLSQQRADSSAEEENARGADIKAILNYSK
jgi:hypothetical protein